MIFGHKAKPHSATVQPLLGPPSRPVSHSGARRGSRGHYTKVSFTYAAFINERQLLRVDHDPAG